MKTKISQRPESKSLQGLKDEALSKGSINIMPYAFVFWILLLMPLLSASINPKLQLVNYTLSEIPAQPGHVLELTLYIKSMEPDNCASRVAVQLAVSYPLSIQGSDTQYAESLCYRDPESAGKFVFRIPIDNLASSGTYPISVTTTYEKRFSKFTESNIINVRVGGSAEIKASVASSVPYDIYPGDSASVSITFHNSGSSLVQSAIATARSEGIEVKWAGARQVVGTIPARSSATANFAIEAPKSLAPGEYPLWVHLDYIGEDRQNGSADFKFMVPIKPKAEFEAYYAGMPCNESCASPGLNKNALAAGSQKEVVLALKNTGSQESRKLKIRIEPLFPFSTDGTVRYVERLAPGESANLTYVITVDKDATQGEQLIGLVIDFEDPQGKKFSSSTNLALPVRSATFIESLEAYYPILAIIGLIVAIAIIRRMLGLVLKRKKD
jgi:hypothetical protein